MDESSFYFLFQKKMKTSGMKENASKGVEKTETKRESEAEAEGEREKRANYEPCPVPSLSPLSLSV